MQNFAACSPAIFQLFIKKTLQGEGRYSLPSVRGLTVSCFVSRASPSFWYRPFRGSAFSETDQKIQNSCSVRAGKHFRILGLRSTPGSTTMLEWPNLEAVPLSVSVFQPSRFANIDLCRLSPRWRVFYSQRTAGAGALGLWHSRVEGTDRHAAPPRWTDGCCLTR